MSTYQPRDKKGRKSKIWWYEFQFAGERYRESSKSRSKTVATNAYRARRREVEEAFNGIKKRVMPKTFAAAVDEFLAVKGRKVAPSTFEIMKRCASHLRPAFGKKLLFEITAGDIMDYKEKRLSPFISPRYVNMDLELVRAVLRRNGFWERIRSDVSMYRLNDEFGYELPESDEPKLLEECARSISRGLQTVVILALGTGMRKGEIKHLRWSQMFLDGEPPYLIVGVSKTTTGQRRRVTLNPVVVAALTEWARQFPDRQQYHYVFPTEKYSKEPDGRLASVYKFDPTRPMGSWRVAWKACCRRAGIQMRFHDLRHTAVTRMLRGGITLTTVARMVGWSPSTMFLMTKRYAHITEPEMQKAAAVLQRTSSGNAPTAARNSSERVAVPGRLRPRYDREELYEKAWQAPLRTLASEYAVSDVALARTYRKLNIPLPGRGYWEKKAANLPVPPRPPLPALH